MDLGNRDDDFKITDAPMYTLRLLNVIESSLVSRLARLAIVRVLARFHLVDEVAQGPRVILRGAELSCKKPLQGEEKNHAKTGVGFE